MLNSRGVAHVFLLLILLLLTIGVGVYLVQHKTNLFPSAAGPSRTGKLVSKGYLVKFKNQPLVEYKKSQAQGVSSSGYENDLSREHDEAKKDIFARLGPSSQATSSARPSQASQKNSLILGEYTKVFNGIALNIDVSQVEKIKDSPYVQRVFPNLQVETTLNQSVPLISANKAWGLTDKSGKPIDGTGVNIAIIDTGVDYTHPDLGGCLGPNCKVIGGYDFVNLDNDPMDDMGHGTHVAAIAAGNGNILKGVAPGAKIVAYKVLGSGGAGYISTVIQGIESSVETHFDKDPNNDIGVINLSLGAFCVFDYNEDCGPDDPTSLALDRAMDEGIVVAVAAGNAGYPETISTPGTSRKAITAGAIDKNERLASFSSQGPVRLISGELIRKPDVVAPGVSICAAAASHPNTSITYSWAKCLDGQHFSLSGTSMATPHVAGFAALLKQQHSSWSAIEIKNELRQQALNLNLTEDQEGSGMIDGTKFFVLVEKIPIYRVYDRERTGERFLTTSQAEVDLLVQRGWTNEGTAFNILKDSSQDAVPVYRVYDRNGSGRRFWTTNRSEVNSLVASGFVDEGVAFYSPRASDETITIYRLYDRNGSGNRLWTAGQAEVDYLVQRGWVNEGTAFYAFP